MALMSVDIEGSVDEVIGVLRRLGTPGHSPTIGDAGLPTATTAGGVRETMPDTGMPGATAAPRPAATEWTDDVAQDFLSQLQPKDRRLALHVWRAGAAGIHRSALCQHAELTPAELRSALIRMGRALQSFQKQREMTLTRPVAANSPLQRYFVNAGFAEVANARMFGDGTIDHLLESAGHP